MAEDDAALIASLPPSFFIEANVGNSPYAAAHWWLSNEAHTYNSPPEHTWHNYRALWPYARSAHGGQVYATALNNVRLAQRLTGTGPLEPFEEGGYALDRAVDMCLNEITRQQLAGNYDMVTQLWGEMDRSRAIEAERMQDEKVARLLRETRTDLASWRAHSAPSFLAPLSPRTETVRAQLRSQLEREDLARSGPAERARRAASESLDAAVGDHLRSTRALRARRTIGEGMHP
jgi:hypothetical protein